MAMSRHLLAKSAIVAVLLHLTPSQTVPAPIIVDAINTGNGSARISWRPSIGAADYLVSAESYSFTESLPSGQVTPGGK